jgi:hypothetical protein
VLDVGFDDLEIHGAQRERAKVRWRAIYRDTSTEEGESHLGAFFIYEGVAFLIGDFARQRRVTFDLSGVDAPPVYPYVAFRTLAQHLAPSITALAAVHLGILALCTNSPGPSLVRAFRSYKALRGKAADDRAACARLRDCFLPELKKMVERILSDHRAQISKMHEERGMLSNAYEIVLAHFEIPLRRRLDLLWFELEWSADGNVDLAKLSALLLTAVPCDVVQERVGGLDDAERDLLFTFGAGEIADDPESGSTSLRALKAQLDYLLTHLRPRARALAETRVPSPRACPFYSSCTLEMRKKTPEICRGESWRRVTEPEKTCWYGVGVASTLGTVKHSV